MEGQQSKANLKTKLRNSLKKIREQIPLERREDASYALLNNFLPSLAHYNHILSFVSFGNEIDTSLLNLFLARTRRLVLPKCEKKSLKAYKVANPSSELFPNAFGIREPNPETCEEIDLNTIQLVLVPALGFDSSNHRLGYGKGFYDRFLKEIPDALTIGIGFKEQLIKKLPTESTDVSLKKVVLF